MMHKTKFHATTALGLCLMAAPLAGHAQDGQRPGPNLDLFAPMVATCAEDPAAEGCSEVRAIVEDCNAAFDLARCELLFDDAEAVFAEPDTRDRAQMTLGLLHAQLSVMPDAATMDEQEAADPAPDAEEAAEAPDEEPEAIAEETEAETPAEVVEVEPTEADEAAAEAVDAAPDEAEAAAENVVPDAARADAEDAAPDAETAAEEAAPEEGVTSEADDTAPVEDATAAAEDAEPVGDGVSEAEAAAAREEELRALEEERARLLAEAEEMGDEAPELVVEEAPEEDFVAPAETAREPDATQQAAIDRLLEAPDVAAAVGLLGSVLAARMGSEGEELPDDQAPAALAAREASEDDAELDEEPEVSEEAITAMQLRSSREDFESRLSLDFDAEVAQQERARRDRRDLERAGLVALGALAVGMIVNRNRVVARSDERVVVDQGDGELELWRDDDAILLEDGTTRRIERFSDGSTRTRWVRPDGSQVITIRDATGRVLRRERVLTSGEALALFDDTRQYAPIDLSVLPPPRTRELRISQRTDPDLALALLAEAEAEARAQDRAFSLRQVREVREVRSLVPLLSPDPITFETNRANVRPGEATKLLQVGRLMERLIADNPREVFLIEGHTDATGPAAFNLALSDRRAESVALALTEFFDIPPENLVVQGYGERHLRIPTLQAEERNRRVAIRRITPLLGL